MSQGRSVGLSRSRMHAQMLSLARSLSLSLWYAHLNALKLSLVCAPKCFLSLSLSYAWSNAFSGTEIWYRII